MDLRPYREKWREVPGGDDTDGRRFSSDLLKLPDSELLATWDETARSRYAGVVGWFGPLYRDFLRGRRVIEIGGGMGHDGIRFASHGAHWTFADIAPDNLEVIGRIASLKGVPASFHLIDDDLSFDGLGEFDVVFACGSLHHVPFDIARRECANLLPHLAPDARWLELVYPRERWTAAGEPPFDKWGTMTDGERTPWAEWYDVDKLRARLSPAKLRTVLDYLFARDAYRWLDFEIQG
jgi:SAM-dependent methyltransferase